MLAPLVRFCLITQALRVRLAKTIRAISARDIDINRRQDLILAVFLRSKDPEYV
ncbi:MAG: acetylglutamate synthase [Yoonia sp.]